MTYPPPDHIPYRQPSSSLPRIILWLALALILSALAVALDGQEMPPGAIGAPTAHPDRVETALLAADAASRALDVCSTHQMLKNGYHELLLPKAIADRSPAMAAYSAGTVTLDWWVSRRLERSNHQRLARLITALDIAQDAPWAIHNLFLKRNKR